ncbi:MAG: hypothetical protein JWP44_1974 [Mucilaginibacter sp.]|nr:hypothetical protein [Mucilaginibacter sp.]
MTLILADRVKVIEGIIDDLKECMIPNFFEECGWAAEQKYNRPGFIRSAITGVLITTAIIACFASRRKSS